MVAILAGYREYIPSVQPGMSITTTECVSRPLSACARKRRCSATAAFE